MPRVQSDIDRGESLPVPLQPVQQKYLSLEGYTVSNLGQRPGIADGKERLAWRAIRPRRWRREPRLAGHPPVQQKYLSQEGYTVSKSACRNGQSAALLSDSGLVMYFSTLPAPSSSAPCILTILTRLKPRATPGDSRWQGKISLEGYTPAKMAAGAALLSVRRIHAECAFGAAGAHMLIL